MEFLQLKKFKIQVPLNYSFKMHYAKCKFTFLPLKQDPQEK